MMERRRTTERRWRRGMSRRVVLRAGLVLSGGVLVGCSGLPGADRSGSTSGVDEELLAWPAEDRWPEQFLKAPPTVQEAYRYAVANVDALQWMPCFCGCRDLGHASNADCYVDELRSDGSVLLDPMSFA